MRFYFILFYLVSTFHIPNVGKTGKNREKAPNKYMKKKCESSSNRWQFKVLCVAVVDFICWFVTIETAAAATALAIVTMNTTI